MTETIALIRHMGVCEKTNAAPSHSLQHGDVEEWLDREIASLRRSVEYEAQGGGVPERRTVARSRRARRLVASCMQAGQWLSYEALRVPLAVVDAFLEAGWFVRRRRFQIVFYGLCIASAAVGAWLIVLIAQP
jgi:hypothetical protein